jgi:hypothetical protein
MIMAKKTTQKISKAGKIPLRKIRRTDSAAGTPYKKAFIDLHRTIVQYTPPPPNDEAREGRPNKGEKREAMMLSSNNQWRRAFGLGDACRSLRAVSDVCVPCPLFQKKKMSVSHTQQQGNNNAKRKTIANRRADVHLYKAAPKQTYTLIIWPLKSC